MKQALQYQRSIQHMLNVAKKQSTIVHTPRPRVAEPTPPPPPPPVEKTKPVEEPPIFIPEVKVIASTEIEETENIEDKPKKNHKK